MISLCGGASRDATWAVARGWSRAAANVLCSRAACWVSWKRPGWPSLPTCPATLPWPHGWPTARFAIGPPDRQASQGLVHASVMLADGSNISLGPFGENNKKPLQGARLQQLVPSLFQLAGGAEAPACHSGLRWPARYRLDRSEERRVGKECVSTCRSRWSPYH